MGQKLFLIQSHIHQKTLHCYSVDHPVLPFLSGHIFNYCFRSTTLHLTLSNTEICYNSHPEFYWDMPCLLVHVLSEAAFCPTTAGLCHCMCLAN